MFPNVESEPLKFVDERCAEQKRLSELLDKYLNPDALPFEGSKALTFYKSAGFSGVKILLRGKFTIILIQNVSYTFSQTCWSWLTNFHSYL